MTRQEAERGAMEFRRSRDNYGCENCDGSCPKCCRATDAALTDLLLAAAEEERERCASLYERGDGDFIRHEDVK